jgi:hypothetical protein
MADMSATALANVVNFRQQLIKFYVDFRLKFCVEVNRACDDFAIKTTAEFMNVVWSWLEFGLIGII